MIYWFPVQEEIKTTTCKLQALSELDLATSEHFHAVCFLLDSSGKTSQFLCLFSPHKAWLSYPIFLKNEQKKLYQSQKYHARTVKPGEYKQSGSDGSCLEQTTNRPNEDYSPSLARLRCNPPHWSYRSIAARRPFSAKSISIIYGLPIFTSS